MNIECSVLRIIRTRVSKLTRDIDVENLPVRLSVRLSIRNVPVLYENSLT